MSAKKQAKDWSFGDPEKGSHNLSFFYLFQWIDILKDWVNELEELGVFPQLLTRFVESYFSSSYSQSHQHFMTSFCTNILLPKNNKAKL